MSLYDSGRPQIAQRWLGGRTYGAGLERPLPGRERAPPPGAPAAGARERQGRGAPDLHVPAPEREVHVEREVPAPTPTPAPRPQPAPTPPPPAAAPTRPAAGVTDSPAVADLKRKLDLLAAALVAAIAAILIRKFLRSLGEGEL